MRPLISVIVPIYNVGQFLRKCIDSLVCQKTTESYEVILIDDGSPDDAPQICDEYAGLYDIVRVVHKKNGGLVSARKTGADIAQGKYVANVDGDDWVSEQFISTIADIINQYHPDVIHFDSINVQNEKETVVHIDLEKGYYDRSQLEKVIFPILVEGEDGRNFDPAICDNVFKRELYYNFQLMVNDRIKIGEDGACSKPIISHSQSLYITDACLYYYRINSQSMTKGKKQFPLDFPMLVGKELEERMDKRYSGFRMQIYRYVTHNLFVACSTAFYSDDSYQSIREKLTKAISNAYYQDAIKHCRYKKSYLKGNLARFILKYRLYFLIKICCMLSAKEW